LTGRLAGKTAIIVGASRGIGRASVEAFLAEGAYVIGCDHQDAAPLERQEQYRHESIDARDGDDVERVLSQIVTDISRVNVLYYNVGGYVSKPIADSTNDDFDRLFALNLRSAFIAIRAVLPTMIEQGSGSILCTSSNGGVMGRPADPLYNATKHGIVGLVRSIAVAHAHQGVRANAIAPGAIETDLLRTLVPEGHHLSDPDITRAIVASTPAARIGRAEEVAATAVFLASDEARFINGITVPIDGAKSAGALPTARYRLDFELGVDS
jgi:NAD(P)-dependent dehydrogenase (short-subunit alcohol dehydrogenase family)